MSTDVEIVPDLVSTIIPVFNRPEMLCRAVASVLAQTYRPIEIIIADDGSTDATPEVTRSLQDAQDGLIQVVRGSNRGPGPAREMGRRVARGEFIQYLDSDDRLLPNKFADQVAALRARSDCGIAYGMTRLVDAEGRVLADPFKWTGREIDALFPGLLVDRWWCTHTPLYRREVAERIGPWSDMRWSQDWEYDSRAGALGVRLVSSRTYVSEHVHHEGPRQTSAGTATWLADPERVKNRLRLLEALLEGAQQAPVPVSAPERQHFARWCFSVARSFAALAMREESLRCLSLAEEAAGVGGEGRKGVRVYRALLQTIGAVPTSRLTGVLARLPRRPSNITMKQSFS